MRIALIGATGQLGTELRWLLPGDVAALGHDQIELRDETSITQTLDAVRPEIVINTAAYNFVDRAEDEPKTAYEINALGPQRLGNYCGRRDIVLVHFSTDYVFGLDADRVVPYSETDAPGPLSVYGTSKFGGEFAVLEACPRHFIIRTCGLYGAAARRGAGKGNFIETMLRLGATKPELRVVNDQICTPTSTVDLAQAVVELIGTQQYGLYHATNAGQTNWRELATETLRRSGIQTPVIPISTEEFGAKARRPQFSALNCDKLTSVIGRKLPDWRDALSRYLTERNQAAIEPK